MPWVLIIYQHTSWHTQREDIEVARGGQPDTRKPALGGLLDMFSTLLETAVNRYMVHQTGFEPMTTAFGDQWSTEVLLNLMCLRMPTSYVAQGFADLQETEHKDSCRHLVLDNWGTNTNPAKSIFDH
jgi:hypothetical protein